MPTSWYQAVSGIMDKIMLEKPASVLDVGVGFGKYGVLLREALDIPYERYGREKWAVRIDGVEAFEGYRNPLHDYAYNNVYYQPIEECLGALGTYDVIIMIDVLEHVPKEKGTALLQNLLSHTGKALVLSTPFSPAPQTEYMGNYYEAHLSRWKPNDFEGFEKEVEAVQIEGNQALIVKLYPGKRGD